MAEQPQGTLQLSYGTFAQTPPTLGPHTSYLDCTFDIMIITIDYILLFFLISSNLELLYRQMT